jgi:hypothetical protein
MGIGLENLFEDGKYVFPRETVGGRCLFLDEPTKRCKIHPVKPETCVAGPITNSPVAVSNGLFTVALDFGDSVFTGEARWLELGVRTNGGDVFTTLQPRQPLQPTPYAIMANSASNLLGKVSAGQLPASVLTNSATGVVLRGTFSGNTTGVKSKAKHAPAEDEAISLRFPTTGTDARGVKPGQSCLTSSISRPDA